MSHTDTGIKAVRDSRGYDVGFTGFCGGCDWFGDLRDTYGSAAGDLWQHIKGGTQ